MKLKHLFYLGFLFFSSLIFSQNEQYKELMSQDWPNLKRYREANEQLKQQDKAVTAVFMGNSITQGWYDQHPDFFTENNYIGRGISGQTTP